MQSIQIKNAQSPYILINNKGNFKHAIGMVHVKAVYRACMLWNWNHEAYPDSLPDGIDKCLKMCYHSVNWQFDFLVKYYKHFVKVTQIFTK